MLKLFPSLTVFVQYAGNSAIAKTHKGFRSAYVDILGTLLDWKPVRALQICYSIGWNSPGHDRKICLHKLGQLFFTELTDMTASWSYQSR